MVEVGVMEFVFDFGDGHFENAFVLVEVPEAIAVDELDFGGDVVDGIVNIADFLDRPFH